MEELPRLAVPNGKWKRFTHEIMVDGETSDGCDVVHLTLGRPKGSMHYD
jgi:hypothetical protein